MTLTFARALAAATLVALAASTGAADAAMPAGTSVGAAHDGAVLQVAAKKKKMTRKQEAEQSAKDGTVPSRYRSQIPKEYHQYIPFAKQ